MKKKLIVGPCVIESLEIMEKIAEVIKEIDVSGRFDVYFKASFDKANRTSIKSYRGPGIKVGIKILEFIKNKYGLKITTDIHESYQAKIVADIVDMIQIPALLCRQTDLICAAAKTGKVLNIKKGQFLSGLDMANVINKAKEVGTKEVFATERGNCFGYNNIVVDFRNIPIMKKYADGVIMDCTHSVQIPGGNFYESGGDPQYIESMALAATAFGTDGYFFEIHPEPNKALCDGPCMLKIDLLNKILEKVYDKCN